MVTGLMATEDGDLGLSGGIAVGDAGRAEGRIPGGTQEGAVGRRRDSVLVNPEEVKVAAWVEGIDGCSTGSTLAGAALTGAEVPSGLKAAPERNENVQSKAQAQNKCKLPCNTIPASSFGRDVREEIRSKRLWALHEYGIDGWSKAFGSVAVPCGSQPAAVVTAPWFGPARGIAIKGTWVLIDIRGTGQEGFNTGTSDGGDARASDSEPPTASATAKPVAACCTGRQRGSGTGVTD